MSKLITILDQAYQDVGAYQAEILYLYTDFRHFGQHMAEFPDRDSFCGAFAAPLLQRDKTVILTTFTYTTEGTFDVLKTPTRLGAMNKWIMTQPDFKRSEHPLFSFAGLGPQAGLLENIGKSAFGYDSVHARLRHRRAAFLHIGRPVSMGNTAIHHIEHTCGATYRIHKAFHTRVYRGERYIGTDYTAFLKRRDVEGENFEFNFRQAAALLFEKGLITQVGSETELSNVSLYPYDQTLDCLAECFYRDQRLFIHSDFLQY